LSNVIQRRDRVKFHPSEEALRSLASSLDGAEPWILRHLAICLRCRSRLFSLTPLYGSQILWFRPNRSESYDEAFERSQRLAMKWVHLLGWERGEARGLFQELMGRTAEQREMLLRNSRRFRTWGLLELLIDRSLETSIQDPRRGEELGRLALRVAGLVDADRYGADRLHDMKARTWAYIGNALRIQSDLQGADVAFQRGRKHLELGTGDLFELALFLDLEASLRRGQRRFPEAARLLNRAITLFSKLNDSHRVGRSLVNLSMIFLYSERWEESIPLLYRAMELIEPETEPRLLLTAKHNLIFALTSQGHFLEAQRAYCEALPLYRAFPDAWTQNRRAWIQGRIARGLGQVGAAEAFFAAARDGFLAEGIPYDTALVALELALLYAEQGRSAELKRLAAELVPVFASRQVHREALAAFAFFQRAVETERAEVEVVERVAKFLRKAWYAPELRFQEDL
jgi:tetratricopeptide (TPR) repeat protein